MKTKINGNTSSNVWYLIKFAYRFAPMYIVLELLHGIIMGVWNSADVIFIKYFYESLAVGASISHVLLLIFCMVNVILLGQIWFQCYRNIWKPVVQQKFQMNMNRVLFEKAKEVDLACYENPEFYNDFVWAMSRSENQIVALMQVISNIITMIASIVTTTTVMLSVSPILAIFTIITSILTILLQRAEVKVNYQSNLAMNPVKRKVNYYEKLFSTADYAKEIRIHDLAERIVAHYDKTLQDTCDITLVYNKERLKYSIPLRLLSDLMQPIVYLILLYQIMVLHIGNIAGLAISFSAFWNLRGRIQAIIDLSARFTELGLYTDKIRTFLNIKPTIKTGTQEAESLQSIRLENVSFSYNDEKEVLHNIHMEIHKGEKIAIVGYNGAGKSTLIKLLCHLYEPTQGEIFYNEINIQNYERDSYKSRIGIVFQDFQIYALPVCENVLCECYSADNKEIVQNALAKATFDVNSVLPEHGIYTELTKEFYEEGTNLSGGESQKIALSRAFAHPYDLLIMDEPSAAMDPLAEYELNKHITEIVGEKTVIIISHRLSTTRSADRIYMFENGEIIETGTHDQLMTLNGKYAEMFRIQAEKYLTS